jgi:hypothetical protein
MYVLHGLSFLANLKTAASFSILRKRAGLYTDTGVGILEESHHRYYEKVANTSFENVEVFIYLVHH